MSDYSIVHMKTRQRMNSIALMQAPDKDKTRKLQTNIPYEHSYKNSSKNTSKENLIV